jgi:hypothetical protein
MKKTVLTFGLISGGISSAMMVAVLPFQDKIGFDKGELLGYTTIVLSSLLVFFGIRSYRDNVAGGTVSFVKAFEVGLLITLVSCACYVVTWEILYYNFMPGFLDKYAAYMSDHLKSSGASPESIQRQREAFNQLRTWYANPVSNAAITFLEPFPVALLITLASSAVLRKRPRESAQPGARVERTNAV